jgi:hypothetical protein
MPLLRLLYCTYGRATGHIRRVNALVQGACSGALSCQFDVYAPESKFKHLLRPEITKVDSIEPHNYPGIIIDQKIESFPASCVVPGVKYFQFVRLGTRLFIPPAFQDRLQRIFIERTGLEVPGENFFGQLLDIEGMPYSPMVARRHLRNEYQLSINGRAALVFVNSPFSGLAEDFLLKQIKTLAGTYDNIVVSTQHPAVMAAVKSSTKGRAFGRVLQCTINQIYRYLNAFQLVVSGCGYNSYYESALASTPEFVFHPLEFRDQQLRHKMRPPFWRLGNEEIVAHITKLSEAHLEAKRPRL